MTDKKFKTVNIKGKEYVEVNERVKYFTKEYAGWSIETELLSDSNGICVFKATIKDENGRVISTGHAYEKESGSFINKTSYIENCETSAVGRALGFLGIGIDTSIASSDEVNNAIIKQIREKLRTITDTGELVKYFMELKLSDEQANILKVDFAKRRAELGGKDGMDRRTK